MVGAFVGGLRAALAAWPAVVWLYVGNLLVGLTAAAGVALTAADPVGAAWIELLGRRPFDVSLAIELAIAIASAADFPGEPAPPPAWPAVLGATLLAPLVYACQSGAVLERLLRPEAGHAWWGGARWFWPFFRLWLLSLAAIGFAISVGLTLLFVQPLAGLVGAAGLVALCNFWFELARAAMVVRGLRSARRGLAAGLAVLVRPSGLGLGLLLLLPSAAVAAAQSGLGASAPPETATAIVSGQVLTLAGAFVKTWRLGAALRCVGA